MSKIPHHVSFTQSTAPRTFFYCLVFLSVAACAATEEDPTETEKVGTVESGICIPEEFTTITAGPGLSLSVPDNAYLGTLASMTCVDLVSTVSGSACNVSTSIGMSHGNIGDLVFKLKSPSGTVVTLMSRPGAAETADNGANTPAGDSSNFDYTYPIYFSTGPSAETAGSTIDGSSVVCQADGICDFYPNNGAALPGNLATFNGTATSGTWKFCVGDAVPNTSGTIDKVTLTFGW